jgi:hypothetical protein
VKAAILRRHPLVRRGVPAGQQQVLPVSVSVGGGYLDRRGAHLDGSLAFVFPAALEAEDIRFNEWVIPSSEAELMVRRDMLGAGESLQKGTALFEKPFETSFNGFTVALRSMDLYCDFTGTDPRAPFTMGCTCGAARPWRTIWSCRRTTMPSCTCATSTAAPGWDWRNVSSMWTCRWGRTG